MVPCGPFYTLTLISCSAKPLSLFGTIINMHLFICCILIPLQDCKLHKGGDSVLFSSVSSLLGLCLPHHRDSESVTRLLKAAFLSPFKGKGAWKETNRWIRHMSIVSFFKISFSQYHTLMLACFVTILQMKTWGPERLLKIKKCLP